MSSPDTNLEKQQKRHKGPLIGIAVVLVFAGVLFLAMLTRTAELGTPVDQENATIAPAAEN